ncbi:Zinc knuckle CX2CX4HX4C [Arabidopsis thaliana x Arabidopsis arenosa]|uniref:Zinc knuckle CX2CX4HX4C n=1 Tax=Arabidopsis thaliana x Arabidopsis arenosa TaxID=1240361 RepID=A0A8T2C1V7_9BRAS|nr:Zinc knuckle CX2CX4HX4C [Arabidopsis thaliana x Arabidopsis arenosa]
MGEKEKDLWLSLQNLNLGSERSPLKLSIEASKKREADHRLSLVVKGLHPSQNPAGIKVMMPKIWQLEGRIASRINDDGTVQFFFKQEHQLLTVLERGPWTYKDWLVVVDRWTHRHYPDFLCNILFWVKVLNIPDDSREDRSIHEIGDVLGQVEDIHIQQPTADKAGEVWVRVKIEVSRKLIFARYFTFEDYREPILIRYIYDKLRKFCSNCGSLTHLAASCIPEVPVAEPLPLPAPQTDSHQEQFSGDGNRPTNLPQTPEAADDTMGDTVGSDTSEQRIPPDSQDEQMDIVHPIEEQTSTIREVDSASVSLQDRGIKRKIEATTVTVEASSSRKKPQGQKSTQAKGEDINRKYKLDIMFLAETKNKDSYVQQLGVELHFHHHFLVSPDGLSGGLAIFWRNTVKCDFLSPPTLYYTDMYISEGPTTFCLTYVYGNPERKLRQQQWLKMETLVKAGLYQSKPRLVLGDFNEIQCNSEKLGGPAKPEWQFSNFRRMLRVSGLHEVKPYGGLYTWIGNRSTGTVKSKLDRIVATADWKNQFPKALVQLLDWIGSDHRPLLLQTENNKWKGTKQFRYDNRWRFKQDLHMALQKSWDQDCSHLPPQRFCEALKRCRNNLSRWKSAQNLNSHKLIQQLHLAIQKAYDSPSPDYNYIMDLKRKLQHEYRLEEEFWRTKSRIQWMQAGDKNTKYFHAKTQQRRSPNRITSIQDAHGTIQKSQKEIQKVVHSYFTDVYSSSGSNNLEPVLQHIQSKVTVEMNQQLTKPVSEGEIY